MKPLRVAGHPVHAAAVHLPMGLFIATAMWDSLAFVTGEAMWWQLSYYSICLGLIAAVVAAIVGFIDFLAIPEGHRGEKIGLYHLSFVLLAETLYLVSFLVRGGPEPVIGHTKLAAFSTSWLALLLLLLGGWFGGELVYRYRVGIDDRSDSVG